MTMNERLHNLKAKGVEEFKRFLIIFVYLWIVFSLFSLNQAIIKRDLGYLAHGFALVNALIFAKIMLVAEDLKLGNRFQDRPLIYPMLYKMIVFSILFILFHILEEIIAALWHGNRIAESFPDIGGSPFIGVVCVWGILSISLIPFFALREIAQTMGDDKLWNLFFRQRATGERSLQIFASGSKA